MRLSHGTKIDLCFYSINKSSIPALHKLDQLVSQGGLYMPGCAIIEI